MANRDDLPEILLFRVIHAIWDRKMQEIISQQGTEAELNKNETEKDNEEDNDENKPVKVFTEDDDDYKQTYQHLPWILWRVVHDARVIPSTPLVPSTDK